MKMLHLLLLSFMLMSCEKNDNKTIHAEGYIVGFNPCSLKNQYATGYVIITQDLKDTLMAFNFPDTIYKFPLVFFQDYENTGYFPSNVRFEYKIRITYTIATESEKIYPFCFANINQSEFYKTTQVIIKTVSID